jgi:phosphogluconate dehydratase
MVFYVILLQLPKANIMTSVLHSVIKSVRERIENRSSVMRAAYLNSLPTKPADRSQMGCANLAHTTAVLPKADRKIIAMSKAPHLGVISAYNDMLSAHHPFANYPELLLKEAKKNGATLQVASGVPAMCDGITQGREGMELSLFSRDVIAMATAVGLSHDVFDAVILLGICDKIAPGLLLGALAFGHLPTVFIPAGPMSSGLSNQEKSKIRQQAAQGLANRETLLAAEESAYHAEGTCTFYGTANSNQLMLDLMGLQFPGGAFVHPRDPERQALVEESMRAIVSASGKNALGIGHIVDARCLVNSLVGLLATGGSTNHAIHWLAVAKAAGYQIDWTDLDDLSKVVPLITRIYPNGNADVNEFHRAGGTAAVGHWLIDAGLIDGDAMTSWGSSLGDTLAEPALDLQGKWSPRAAATTVRNATVLRKPSEPFQADGGLRLLQGNLGRAITKVSAVDVHLRVVEAPCRVFENQQDVLTAFHAGELDRNIVVVVRFQGPRANGMPELHKLTPVLSLVQDRGFKVALVTDGRMSGASGKVLAAIHVTPEASIGGALAKLKDGDIVRVDAVDGTLFTSIEVLDRQPVIAPVYGGNLGRSYFEHFRSAVTGAEQGASVLFKV